MLTPYPHRVLPPPTAADMAHSHSTHSTQPALQPHRTTPRAEDKPPQTHRPHSNGLCSPLSEGPDPGSAQRHVNAGSPVQDDMLTPTGYSPPAQQPIWPTAHTAHSQHCSHTALPSGQKTNPRRRTAPLKRSMLTSFGGPRPRFGAKARERWFTRSNGSD